MKNQTNKNLSGGVKLLILLPILISNSLFAQEEEGTDADNRPVRPTFESALLMDLQSVMVPNHKTLEFDIQHRFGTVEEGITDLFGIYAPANIRMGFTYTPINNLAVGFGFGKFKKYLDLSLKYAILKQRRDWSIPVSLTYYTNIARDSRDKSLFSKPVHRFSYHHELIIASRLSSKLSLQVAPSFSHYNAIDSLYSNDIIAISAGGRFRFSSQGAILINYVQQITNHDDPNFDLKPNITIGLEFSTGSHAFQVFVSNYQGILPQENNTFNEYDFTKGEFLIGFNITRLWSF
ncbi:MAG TPA: DUF5777 family beta-barrel protein [Cyclobacteriaceae bacterium]|jgi:hypothetical protein